MKPNEMMNGYALGIRESAIEEARQSEEPLEPLMWLLLAVNEGRVVVLPCKVGDTVYYINTLNFAPLKRNRVYRAEVTRIVITQRSVSFVAKVRYAGGVSEIVEDGFGKTIFLTREEAEQALKGAQHEE